MGPQHCSHHLTPLLNQLLLLQSTKTSPPRRPHRHRLHLLPHSGLLHPHPPPPSHLHPPPPVPLDSQHCRTPHPPSPLSTYLLHLSLHFLPRHLPPSLLLLLPPPPPPL